jgi:hypothetical protein
MGGEEKIIIKLYYHGDKEKRYVNVKCKDLAKFEDVQNFAAKHWDINTDTCAVISKGSCSFYLYPSNACVFFTL